MSAPVLLVPGFQGGVKQPLLLRLQAALAARALDATPVALTQRRPSRALGAECDELEALWLEHQAGAVIGRSFGGRVAARLAARVNLPALVLLGFPIRPPGKRRLEDELALKALGCPTLILQGENDELGAPAIISEVIAGNPHIAIEVLPGAKHAFGKQEGHAVERAAAWLTQTLS